MTHGAAQLSLVGYFVTIKPCQRDFAAVQRVGKSLSDNADPVLQHTALLLMSYLPFPARSPPPALIHLPVHNTISARLPSLRSLIPEEFIGKSGPLQLRRGSDCASLGWLQYAQKCRNHEGVTQYCCLWKDDRGTTCGYVSKRASTKRHIEDRHMGNRPHCCEYCDQAFAQKTNLIIHENRRQRPHECIFGCGKAFSDPAQCHRHHKEAHNYVPRQVKPRAATYERSGYETERPWAV
ncbi:hypothetical protein FISHEDRAFT_61764 [Fistulina hepatica ATCC 64428]|uniref:C2H2-type domain-containing protein n=1 Tax=Fistulina hepatica ATCC 64428 TaxID=1128425 RepID=A0A0D7A1N8_9AGAR|nr:hypothetical protein FISHEDRAFT_61764 [Fistulina hepatica ATCC 64428]